MYTLDTSVTKLIELIPKAKVLGIDTETTGLDFLTDTVTLIQIKVLGETHILDARKIPKPQVTKLLNVINSSGVLAIGHNITFDMKFLFTNFNVMLMKVADTMLAERLCRNGLDREKFYSYKDLVLKYCNRVLEKETRLEFVDNPDIELTEVILIYSALDVEFLEEIYNLQLEILKSQGQLKILDVENDAIPAVVSMEINGILVSVPEWTEHSLASIEKLKSVKRELLTYFVDNLLKKIKKNNALEFANELLIPVKTKKQKDFLVLLKNPEDVRSWIESNLNLNSHNQMLRILNLLDVPVKTTDEKELSKHLNNPVIERVLYMREFEKKVSTYGLTFLTHIHPKTGRVHCNIFQLGTASGRMSSNFTLMQMPRDPVYRNCFKPAEGYVYLNPDFSQEELRLFGAVTKERKIIDAYVNGIDLHKLTASLMFNVSLDEVTSAMRQKGKTMNFASIYGTTAYGLAVNFKMDKDEAKVYLENFWKGYPTAKRFMDKFSEFIWEHGYSTTVLGRKRFFEKKSLFPTLKLADKYKAQVLRELGNHLIQGTGADVLKLCISRVFRNNPFGDDMRLILTVHDELLLEVKKEIAKEANDFVVGIMESTLQEFLGEIPAVAGDKENWENNIHTKWEH